MCKYFSSRNEGRRNTKRKKNKVLVAEWDMWFVNFHFVYERQMSLAVEWLCPMYPAGPPLTYLRLTPFEIYFKVKCTEISEENISGTASTRR